MFTDPTKKTNGAYICKNWDLTRVFMLAGIAAFSISACADTGTNLKGEPISDRTEIVNIMKKVFLHPEVGRKLPLCKSFYQDFSRQTNIEYIEPLVSTDNYDDPRLMAYLKKCPNLKLNKHAWFGRVNPDQVRRDLIREGVQRDQIDEELDKYASGIRYGTKGFKLYEIKSQHKNKIFHDALFYDEKQIVDKPDTSKGREGQLGLGTYRLVDFNSCESLYGTNVGEAKWIGGGEKSIFSKHDVITYKNHIYISDLEIVPGLYGQLRLMAVSSGQKGIDPICVFNWNRDSKK